MVTKTKADDLAGGPGRGQVLLITDEPSRLAPAARQLEAAGFAVNSVRGGTVALVTLHRAAPHLAILDVALKGISAAEFTRTVADMDAGGGAPPVILVGEQAATAERQLAAIAGGAFDYFRLPDDLPLLVARAAQLVKLKQLVNRLYAETNRDVMTGLTNRRLFQRRLGQEMEKWRRYKFPSSLLSLDIDYLKRINDTLGHAAGDVAIRHVADALNRAAGPNDVASRLGGEEFALLLPGKDEAQALSVAEDLRRRISAAPVEGVGLITVSIGVASCPAHADSARGLYQAADDALYCAKREGRNRSAVAAPAGGAAPNPAARSE